MGSRFPETPSQLANYLDGQRDEVAPTPLASEGIAPGSDENEKY
jgi:hypothetical protein